MERKLAWDKYGEKELKELTLLADGYKKFLDAGKTERECVDEAVRQAKAKGYTDLNEAIANGKTLKAGDKVYAICMNKAVALFNIGTKPLSEGMTLLGAHVDSPRLDLKQNPLYEDNGFALLDTHYYGGVKKYQWVTLPLAIHGVVSKKDGTNVNVVIGEDDNDPVFCITDLLIHLSARQLDKKAATVIEGEALDVLFASMPISEQTDEEIDNDANLTDEEKEAKKKEKVKDKVAAHAMKLLSDKYGIEEEDFLSAELEIVPAGKARDCGIDSSMVIAYGHDDRVCAYTSLVAMLEVDKVEKTTCCLLVDKEEIGSVGATGMQSRFFENTVAELIDRVEGYNELTYRRCLANSKMLSSDVSAAYDPNFPEAFEKKNTAFFGKGMVFNKYTGARGKSGSNDANSEYFAEIRRMMDDNDVSFQTAELGKVDFGGGGTIAYIMALYGMNVIDAGIAVLNMHAPWEIISKADLYETTKGYVAFLREA